MTRSMFLLFPTPVPIAPISFLCLALLVLVLDDAQFIVNRAPPPLAACSAVAGGSDQAHA